jgi:hypothetical protein
VRNLLFIRPAPPAPPTAVEIIEALEQARQILDCGRNLAKGSSIDWVEGWPCWCIVAAITHASRTTQIRDAAIRAVKFSLPSRFQGRAIEAYNDHPSTTLDDAKALLWHAKSYVGSVAA